MNCIKKILSVICLIAVLMTVCSTAFISVSAANEIKVELIASALKAEPNDRFSVSYSFTNAADYKYGLSAFTSFLRFEDDKVKCVKVTHSKFNNTVLTTNRNLTGEVRTLYTYANLNKKPGVNSDAAFVTYEFVVKKDAVGKVNFTLDFDTVTSTDYDYNPVKNISLAFNKPTFTVEIVNPNAPVSSEQQSSKPSSDKPDSSSNTSKETATSSKPTSSSQKPSSSSSPDKDTTVKNEYLNPDFDKNDVATGETETFESIEDMSEYQSELTESMKDTMINAFSEGGVDAPSDFGTIDNDDNPKNGNMLLIIMIIAAGLLLGAAITIIIIISMKKK